MKRLRNEGPQPQPIGLRAFYLVDAGYTPLIADESYERDHYPFCTVEYVEQGCGRLEIEGTIYTVNAGDVYVLPALRHHRYWPEQAWRKYFFVAQGSLMDNLLRSYGLSGHYHFPQAAGVRGYFKTMSQWRSWTRREPVHATAAVLAHRLIQQLAALPRSVTGLSERIARIKTLLDIHPEQSSSLADLAAATHLSRQHLMRLFKAELGISPHQYLLPSRHPTRQKQSTLFSSSSLSGIHVVFIAGQG